MTNPPPAPVIKTRPGPSLVWIIPLVTLLIGGWLIIKTASEKGPEITIAFKTAEGIEAGKTRIRYKNLDVGTVDSLRFGEGFANVILTASIDREAESFLRRDTRFWVVKPRLGLRGASGLSTLISGSYIELEPGKGAPQHHFVGLESPPVVKAGEAGSEITLVARRLGSLNHGSPVYYQGIVAGEILGYQLGNDQRSVFIHAFVKAPYDKLVRGNSRFWNISGVEVSMNADGFNVRTESLESLLYGGIAFETPTTLEPVEEHIGELVFTLHEDYGGIEEQAYTQKINFVLFFDGSVRGLTIGAPVEFKGIRVGKVVDLRLEFDSGNTTFRIPVVIEIEPERVIARDAAITSPYKLLETLVERGLRARLQTGSLLTGQLFIELGMFPETPIRLANADTRLPELPTVPAELEEITTSIKTVLAQLERVDFESIGRELAGTLQGTNQLINSPELTELTASFGSLRGILAKLDARAEPIAENVELAVAAGNRALGRLEQVLRPDSPFQYRMNEMTEELSAMARSIRTLVDVLEREPQSLLFGRSPPGEQ